MNPGKEMRKVDDEGDVKVEKMDDAWRKVIGRKACMRKVIVIIGDADRKETINSCVIIGPSQRINGLFWVTKDGGNISLIFISFP